MHYASFGPYVMTAVALALVAGACGSGGSEPNPGGAGEVRVTVATVGSPAPAAFTVQVDGGTPQTLAASGSLELSGLSQGTHTVTVSGVSPYCSIAGSIVGSRTDQVTVTESTVATLTYAVTCQAALRNRLVYARILDGRLRIVAAHVDGTGEIPIGDNPEPMGSFMDVTADGTKIVYITGSYPNQNLTVISSLGEPLGNIPTSVCATQPAWSPDGTRLVFDDCSTGGLRIVNADGSGEVGLPKPAALTSARWTPDGQKLVYARSVGFVSHIAMSNLDGSGEVMLTTAAEEWAFDPAISQDGTRVVFARRAAFDATAAELVVVDISGTGERNLVTNGIHKMQPRWSPSGETVAYRQDDGPPSFRAVNALGGTPWLVVQGQGELAEVNWTW